MNKPISNTRKAIKLFILAAVLTSFSLSSQANDPKDKPRDNKHRGSASTAEVSYIGGKDGDMFFNVVYNNMTGAKFNIIVLDGEGNRIFQGSFTDKQFDRKFKVTGTEAGSKLVFIVRSGFDNSLQRFEIASDTKMIEDIEVKEVK
jgi:hypothetical protein